MGQVDTAERLEHVWRRARWILLAAAIGLQSLQQWCFGCLNHGFFNPDKAYQVSAARSLLDGYGLTRPEPNRHDVAAPVRRPVFEWPLGYSLVLAGVWHVAGDLWTSAVLVEVLGVVLFFTAWLAILDGLGTWLSPSVKLAVMAYWALVWNPLVPQTGPEIVAHGLFCWAVAFGLWFVTGRRPLVGASASAVCLAAAAAFRFAYWPLLAVVPLALAAGLALSPRKRSLAAAWALHVALVGLLFVGVVSLQQGLTGRTTFLSDPNRSFGGPWPANLLSVCPFPAAAIGFDYVWSCLARHVPWIGAWPETGLEWFVSAIVLAAVLIPAVNLVRRLCRPQTAAAPDRAAGAVFAAAGLLTVGATLAMLVHLSLVTPMEHSWTYVAERRYFAVFFAFWSVALAWSVLALTRFEGGPVRQAVKWAALGLALAWCVIGATWRTSRFVRHYADARGSLTARRESMSECRAVYAAVRTHVAAGRASLFVHPDLSPVYSFGEQREHVLAMMAGAPAVDFQGLTAVELGPGKTAAVLAVLPEPRTPQARAAEQWLRARGRLEPLVRLRDGWLYQAVWSDPAGHFVCPTTTTASRSSEPCPTR